MRGAKGFFVDFLDCGRKKIHEAPSIGMLLCKTQWIIELFVFCIYSEGPTW